MSLTRRWKRLIESFGATRPPAPTGAALLDRWTEDHRRYHDRSHLTACLDHLDRWRETARQPAVVALALWYHDAIYDPRADNNEAASAEVLRDECARLGLPQVAIDRAAELVLATDHRRPLEVGDVDAALIIDIDLATLGADPATYDRYAAAVREEHAHVPDDRYRVGRSAVLTSFLARERIFVSSVAETLEALARANLERELANLR